eukprot:2900427-Pyramimonas_sp.AAC.2
MLAPAEASASPTACQTTTGTPSPHKMEATDGESHMLVANITELTDKCWKYLLGHYHEYSTRG